MNSTVIDGNLGVSAHLIRSYQIPLETSECLQFIDLTPLISEIVASSTVNCGIVNIQSCHTTAAIMVNENEPMLLLDIRRTLERVAPGHIEYKHDDFATRTENLLPDEKENGHSHCKAIFLRTSETLNIVDGLLQLGQWQSLFLVELDRPRSRTVSVMVMGQSAPTISSNWLVPSTTTDGHSH